MGKKLLSMVVLMVLMLSFGCGSGNMVSPSVGKEASMDVAYPESTKGEYATETGRLDLTSIEQKIIKNGEIFITVQNNELAEAQVLELVTEYQGLVQNINTYTGRDSSNTDLVVRIPNEKFDIFIEKLKNLGQVTRNRIYTTDVTEEYIDLTARQKTLKLQEERLQEMVKKASNVDELLKVEKELARVRGEIEGLTGRLNYLDNRISFSTIEIYLRTKYIPTQAKTKNFGEEILFSFQDGISSFLNFTLWFIKTIIWLLPFLGIGVPIFALLWRKFHSRRSKD